ncbi:hypothetical protein [Wolbachia endosymbiont of Ctenocephalides felis wCfeT]|uniref:hypothetical protein n=1 Tax=Wolbachia endosymbiont of Ctenocephalides felis wCfeT TaxID=2732593 RepID=UPI001445D2A9|nr:hypothetical protein [Wolbachia endosymbiont of Ctenocephalides felis wCfeT]
MSILKSLLKTAIAILLLICVSSASFASESSKNSVNSKRTGNFYIGLSLGQVIPINDLLSKSISASVGYKVKYLNAEIDSTLASLNNADRTSIILTLMANAYFHFYNRSNFTPYIGFGIGFSEASIAP